jgi:hypothetical protein
MKNKNYGIAFGSLFLVAGGFIVKFLWFVLLFILVWGLAKFVAEFIPFVKDIGKFLKLDKLDQKFTLILDWIYKHLPDLWYYIFLLRVPIISAGILILFPLIAQFLAPEFLQNIFVLKDGNELILVMLAATFTAITIISLLKTILVLIDNNFQDDKNSKILRSFLTIILFLPTWILLLSLNNEKTNLEDINWIYRILGIVIGLIPFVITQFYEYQVILSIDGNLNPEDQKSRIQERRSKVFIGEIVVGIFLYTLIVAINWPSSTFLKDWQLLKNWQNWQAPTLLYILLIIWVLTLFIGLVTFLFDESVDNQLDNQKKSLEKKAAEIGDNEKEKEKFLINFLKQFQKEFKLLNHTFYWPVILFLIIFSGLGYGVWGVDHFFKLETSNSPVEIQNYKQDFQEAIWNRLCEEKFDINNKTQTCNKEKEQSLVVVAASGGGIQASGWMTQVLEGLQDRDLGIGEDFTKAIGLISSTSGGSVGSMFYLDQFENGVLSVQGLKKDENKLSKVVKNSTDDWLNSVGWGLAFPDLFRAIGLPPLLYPFRELGGDHKPYLYLDRGDALEKNWQKTLTVGGKKPPTLDDRREQILKGEIPIAVYNTTLVENGRPFFVSSMKFVEGTMENYVNESSAKVTDTALDFKTLYNNCGENGDQSCDLALTTAARLSASFPYVTPMARNDRENIIEVNDKNGKKTILQNYHIADGGYYDNAGSFTAMNWLNKFLQYNNSVENKDHRINIKKVIVLQINAFSEENLRLDQKGSLGFVVSTIGPLNTLAGIRDSTQIGRNKIFADLLKARWNNDKNNENNIKIQDFAISFPQKDPNGKNYNPPLSWRLTQRQKINLVEAWEKDTEIRKTVETMKTFWTSEAKPKT